LTELKFKDLCSEEHNAFVRRVLSCACDGKHGEGKDQKERSKIAKRICQSVFSQQENLVYSGVKHLQQALNEHNIERRKELIV
jgi:hypothetical protein